MSRVDIFEQIASGKHFVVQDVSIRRSSSVVYKNRQGVTVYIGKNCACQAKKVTVKEVNQPHEQKGNGGPVHPVHVIHHKPGLWVYS